MFQGKLTCDSLTLGLPHHKGSDIWCGENPKGNKIYLEIEEDVYSCLYEIVNNESRKKEVNKIKILGIILLTLLHDGKFLLVELSCLGWNGYCFQAYYYSIAFIFIHILYLHYHSSNNILRNTTNNKIPFFPYIISKDLLFYIFYNYLLVVTFNIIFSQES